jgi:hypothetical protein
VVVLGGVIGCGADSGDDGTPEEAPSAAPVSAAPMSTAPVPRGDGGTIADDVNGDGYPDLAYAAAYGPADKYGRARQNCAVVVYGSAKGLDPAVRTVLEPNVAALPVKLSPVLRPYPVLADLDADGYADLKFGPDVIWGGPTGPDPRTQSTGLAELTGTPGDFDGDGRLDLPAVEDTQDNPAFRVLYGPIDRNGSPSRRGDSRPDPVNHPDSYNAYSLRAVDADGDRTADLVASRTTDDEQREAFLLEAGDGPGGFAARARKLRTGSSVASGDFDGDGKGDLVVGDSGSRNDEPGYETEAPDVDGTFTVYPGDGGPPRPYDLDLAGDYLTGDLDGDGRDELLIGDTTDTYPVHPDVTVVRGLLRDRADPGTDTLSRIGPARVPGTDRGVKKNDRYARLAAVRDFDQDGRDEVVLHWTLPERGPSYVWVVDGGGKDVVAFHDGRFTETE